eukprot:m.192760 g.192760  ORF g.192760 m.192760 type:complete len:587 (-) comp18611_c0_seq1:1318-3078(-)
MESADPETDLVKYSNCFHDGEKLEQAGMFEKAIQRYSMAMDAITNANGLMTVSEGRFCLTNRARCYLALGQHKNAYEDAEKSLEEDPLFIKGMLMKAEALYMKGDFEYALMFFHRGNRLRPEMGEFDRGISKSAEAISNSVGSADCIALSATKGDLSLFYTFPTLGDDASKKTVKGKPGKPTLRAAPEQRPKPSERSVKALLGELYTDRQYIEELMEDPSLVTTSADGDVTELLSAGMTYLDDRVDFWRQQKPIYAIQNTLRRNLGMETAASEVRRTRTEGGVRTGSMGDTRGSKRGDKRANTGQSGTQTPTLTWEDAVAALSDIEASMDREDYDDALTASNILLQQADASTMPGRSLMLGAAHAAAGSALLELDRVDEAIVEHEADLEIATRLSHVDAMQRAQVNLGKACVANGDYARAIEVWEAHGDATDPAANAWLHHELGRCHLALHRAGAPNNGTADGGEADTGTSHLARADSHALQAHRFAVEAHDHVWELASSCLMAQVKDVGGATAEAIVLYDRALIEATAIGDDVASEAVEEARAALRERLEEEGADSAVAAAKAAAQEVEQTTQDATGTADTSDTS